jgi:NADPH:quinone reductase-like Zn-dependent oxidoreductase
MNMRAAQIEGYGGTEVLQVVDIDPPTPGPGQVLLEVHGSSINPADIAIRNGWMQEFLPLPLPVTLGIDVAGTVAELGEGVEGLAVGDPVYGAAGVAMGGSGAFAEMAVTSPAMLAAPPAGLDLVLAATLPLAGVSALQAIAEALDVQPGHRVLVHGGSGGVGLFAVALAKHLGAYVVGTAHSDGVAVVSAVGADEVVDTEQAELTSLEPFDRVLDLVGQDPVLPVTVTKPGGRAVGLLTPPDQQAAEAKGVTAALQGTQQTSERLDRLRELVEQGVLSPHVVETYDLGDIARAFTRKEAGGVHGKIAIAVR